MSEEPFKTTVKIIAHELALAHSLTSSTKSAKTKILADKVALYAFSVIFSQVQAYKQNTFSYFSVLCVCIT